LFCEARDTNAHEGFETRISLIHTNFSTVPDAVFIRSKFVTIRVIGVPSFGFSLFVSDFDIRIFDFQHFSFQRFSFLIS